MSIRSVWGGVRGALTPSVIITFFCTAVVFGIIGWFIPSPVEVSKYIGGVLLQSSNYNNYKYIDPLLTCEIGGEDAFDDLRPFKAALADVIDQAVDKGEAERVSVYFRFLKSAHWFSINPEQTYAPASLLKIFVMMAYYKESRDLNNPNLLNQQVLFKASPNPAKDDNPGAVIPHLANDQLYTINDVIKQMIVYSDNDALNTLVDNFDQLTTQNLSEIFSDLQISSPLTDESSYFMSVDQYARVFRVLFNSTYLSRRLSEQALGMLADAQFKLGLVAGVPPETSVAHKFGVASLPATATTPASAELHDCGVVYYPGNPYVLCVMTKGSDFSMLADVIRKISAEAYTQVGKL